MIIARIGRVCARRTDHVSDVTNVAAPFLNGFLASAYSKPYTILPKEIVKFLDAGRGWSIDNGMVDITDRCPSLNPCEPVDRKYFGQPGG